MVTYRKHEDPDEIKQPEEFEVKDPAEEKKVDVPVVPAAPVETDDDK